MSSERSFRSLTVGGMLGGSACSEKELLIAYRLLSDQRFSEL